MSTPPTQPPHRNEQRESLSLSPNDHLRTLVELLKPGGADLARRWVAALMLAPAEERERIVEAVEAKIVELYALDEQADDDIGEAAAASAEAQEFDLVEPPVQKEGRVEQTIHTYAAAAEASLEAKRNPGDRRRQA